MILFIMIINLNVGYPGSIVNITPINQPAQCARREVMQTYQTGDSLIFKVPEREISLQPAALYPEAFPVAEAEAVIQPIALSIHSWVVQTPTI